MSAPAGASRSPLRYLDLALLAMALPIFIVAELPMLGLAVAATVWLAARGAMHWAERRMLEKLASGERRSAMAFKAFSTMGRVWLVAGAVLAVGVIGDREDGLAAAILAAALFTAEFVGTAISRAISEDAT